MFGGSVEWISFGAEINHDDGTINAVKYPIQGDHIEMLGGQRM